MTDMKALKAKYSGQAIPEWELEAAGLVKPEKVDEAEAPKRRGRPPKVQTVDEDEDE